MNSSNKKSNVIVLNYVDREGKKHTCTGTIDKVSRKTTFAKDFLSENNSGKNRRDRV